MSVIRRPNDDALVVGMPLNVADVRLMRVRRDDEVDLRVETLDDRLDRTGEVVTAVDVHEATGERRVLLPALVDQDDEGANTLVRPQRLARAG